jgi:hypothetical protein
MDAEAHILIFPIRHRGDPDPRRTALAGIGFRWDGVYWRRGRIRLSDEAIDAMDECLWQQRLRRWTTRRPQRRQGR